MPRWPSQDDGVTPERVADWRRRYEAGESLDDIAAAEAARGRSTCAARIRAHIARAGATIKTRNEGRIGKYRAYRYTAGAST